MRGERRIKKVLTAVRMFLVHTVVNKAAPAWVLEQIYELGDNRDLPQEARGESGALRYRVRTRHRLQEPRPPSIGRAAPGHVPESPSTRVLENVVEPWAGAVLSVRGMETVEIGPV